MLECVDISNEGVPYNHTKICFAEEETGDDVVTITMHSPDAVNMAKSILRSEGYEAYYTLTEARKILAMEMAEKV